MTLWHPVFISMQPQLLLSPSTSYPAPPLPEPNPFHLFSGGTRASRACSASVANQPSWAVSFDGERNPSPPVGAPLQMNWWCSDSGGGRRCGRACGGEEEEEEEEGGGVPVEGVGVGGGKWIIHTSKQFVMLRLLSQIWQQMRKQSVPLNDDNSTSSSSSRFFYFFYFFARCVGVFSAVSAEGLNSTASCI